MCLDAGSFTVFLLIRVSGDNCSILDTTKTTGKISASL
jgi:hypothetical protein